MKLILMKVLRKINKILHGSEYVATNDTIKIARKLGVNVGKSCRFYSTNFSSEPYLITIGDHVTITDNVQFITHDGAVWVFREEFPGIDLFGKISIGNNVFIGLNTIVLPGTKVGNNVIIAAGSVLKGTYEDDSVIAGVPGKRITGIQEYYNKNRERFVFFKGISSGERLRKIKESNNL